MLLSGCSDKPEMSPTEYRNTLCDLLFPDSKLPVEEILARFGTPDEVKVEPIANKHVANVIDEIHLARFRDGQVAIYVATAVGRNLVLSIRLTGQFWPDRVPSLAGDSTDQVRTKLGDPDEAEGQVYRYYCGESDSHVAVNLEDSRVAWVYLLGYVD